VDAKILAAPGLSSSFDPRYTTWAAHHWEWVDSLLNEHFLTQWAAALLACYVEESRQPDPIRLAEEWAEQLSWFDEKMRERHVVILIPPISDFLGCLEAELLAHPIRSMPQHKTWVDYRHYNTAANLFQ
jgi:hypothetical protein